MLCGMCIKCSHVYGSIELHNHLSIMSCLKPNYKFSGRYCEKH